MEQSGKDALRLTKELHTLLKQNQKSGNADDVDWKKLLELAVEANRAARSLRRHAQDDAVRAQVRENVLREAVRDELIDREANAARVAAKQTAMLEQASGTSEVSVFEKAQAVVRQVEAAVATLAPYQTEILPGVAVLFNESKEGASDAGGASGASEEVEQEEE